MSSVSCGTCKLHMVATTFLDKDTYFGNLLYTLLNYTLTALCVASSKAHEENPNLQAISWSYLLSVTFCGLPMSHSLLSLKTLKNQLYGKCQVLPPTGNYSLVPLNHRYSILSMSGKQSAWVTCNNRFTRGYIQRFCFKM